MSLLNPVLVPVKIYRSTDTDAPVLDKTANCVATIIKACLVTGYGAKAGAGWTLKNEDLETKTKVFDINSGVGEPLSLRIYNDTGAKLNIQVVKNVVDANTVTPVIECDTVFNYLGGFTTGEWMLIASDKGLWFFAPISARNKPSNRGGVYLFAGVVPGTTSSAFLIKHTGGTFADGDSERYAITSNSLNSTANSGATKAAVYNLSSGQKDKAWLNFISDGMSNVSDVALAAPLCFVGAGDVYQLPVYSPSRNDLENFDAVNGSIAAINFCTSTQYRDDVNNAYVLSDNWSY